MATEQRKGHMYEDAAVGFNRQVDTYEAHRPSYPPAAVACVVERLGVTRDAGHVLEIGSGTGKFTRQFRPLVHTLTAVEPVPGMRAKFAALLPDVPVLEGTADHLPVADASVDGIVVAQAFHWFSSDATLREFRRVLKPGASVVLIWNTPDPAYEWMAHVRSLANAYQGNNPQYFDGSWKAVFDTETARGLFTPPRHEEFGGEASMKTIDEIWKRQLSVSFVAAQTPEEQERLRQRVYDYCATLPAFRPGGPQAIEGRYKADVYSFQAK